MSVLRRDYHWTDLEVHVNPDRTRRRQRRIKNWENFRRPDSNNINRLLDFEGTNDSEQPTQNSAPDHWMGNYDFKYQLLNQPLQVFLGDSTTPRNTALWGMRKTSNPRAWVNFKAIGVNNDVSMEVFGAQKAVRWQNLWDNSTLWLQAARHKITKQIRLSAPGHPASFRFVMRIPDGYSYEISNNVILIKDENGKVQLQTKAPYGWDSATVGPGPSGEQDIRATLTETNPVTVGNKSFPSFLITPNPDDLASAVYPVFVDPDTTIGAGSIEDTYFSRIGNRGGSEHFQIGQQVNQIFVTMFRYATADIPDDITSVNTHRLDFVSIEDSANTTNNTFYVHRLGTNRSGWVQGTNTSFAETVGEPSRYRYIYDTDSWIYEYCYTHAPDRDDTPYECDIYPSDPILSFTIGTPSNLDPVQLNLTGDGLTWPMGWKNGDYNNSGMRFGFLRYILPSLTNRLPVAFPQDRYLLGSTENGTPASQPSVFLDYEGAPAASAAVFFGSNF